MRLVYISFRGGRTSRLIGQENIASRLAAEKHIRSHSQKQDMLALTQGKWKKSDLRRNLDLGKSIEGKLKPYADSL